MTSLPVLIVEDDPDQLEVRSLLVASAGYSTVRAATAQQALLEAQTRPFLCALVDLCLPSDSDGLTLLHQLRELQPDLPLLVLTGAEVPPGAPHHQLIRKASGAGQILRHIQLLAALSR